MNYALIANDGSLKLENFNDPQNPDNTEDFDQSSSKDATVEGEQLSENLTGPQLNISYGNRSESTSLESASSESNLLNIHLKNFLLNRMN